MSLFSKYMKGEDRKKPKTALPAFLAALGGVLIPPLLFSGCVSIGYAKYVLDAKRGKLTDVRDVFGGYKRLADGLLLLFYCTIHVIPSLAILFLGLHFDFVDFRFSFERRLLIYAAAILTFLIGWYMCSLTSFVLADRPELTPREAIRESRRLTRKSLTTEMPKLLVSAFSVLFMVVGTAVSGYYTQVFLNPILEETGGFQIILALLCVPFLFLTVPILMCFLVGDLTFCMNVKFYLADIYLASIQNNQQD